jgi:hypothetical protein
VSETKNAMLRFQYSEKIKSELIMTSKLLEALKDLKDEERKGAEKLFLSFLNALRIEINIARNVSQINDFEKVDLRVEEAALHVKMHEYSEAFKRISEAISITTTSGQKSVETLKRKGML